MNLQRKMKPGNKTGGLRTRTTQRPKREQTGDEKGGESGVEAKFGET